MTVDDVRYRLAGMAGRTVQAASKRLGRGHGAVIGGRVARAIDPDVLRRAAREVVSVAVSGTNGKTTTTQLIAAALAGHGPVLTNTHGANLPNGVISALLEPHPPGSFLVAEIDERWLPAVMAEVPLRVLTLLNLSRDQIDRMAEVRSNAIRWRAALERADGVTVVANADDPLVTHAVPPDTPVVWVGAGMRWRWDAIACPACGGRIDYQGVQWACRSCPHARPLPSVTVDGDTVVVDGDEISLASELPGAHTRANSAMAIAAAKLLGVAPADAARAMGTVTEVDGRYRPLWGSGRPGRLFLGKNPAGWLEVLEVLDGDDARPLVLVFNARQPDGRDPSWLWDVPIERLQGRTVIVAGERAMDMAVRLRYAGVDHVVAPSLEAALADGRVLGADVLATYTAFWQVKGVLADGG